VSDAEQLLAGTAELVGRGQSDGASVMKTLTSVFRPLIMPA